VQTLKSSRELSWKLILRNFHLFDIATAHGLDQHFLFVWHCAELFQKVSGSPVEREKRASILVFDSICLELLGFLWIYGAGRWSIKVVTHFLLLVQPLLLVLPRVHHTCL